MNDKNGALNGAEQRRQGWWVQPTCGFLTVPPLLAENRGVITRMRSKAAAGGREMHPSATLWLQFFEADMPDRESDRMAAHLARCPDCQTLVASLPKPPRHIFGRPMAATGVSAVEVEELVRKRQPLFETTSGSITVGGPWHSEPLVPQVIPIP